MRVNVISSPTNQKIKDLVRLKDRKGEQSGSSFAVEGLREIERAIACGFECVEIYHCPDLIAKHNLNISTDTPVNHVSKEAFQKIAVREGSDGVIAIFKIKQFKLDSLANILKSKTPLLIAVEDVEKPGNLGAILRTADAAGVHAVIALDQAVDPWNQHVIRASLGGVFSVPVIVAGSADFYEWTKAQAVTTIAAALSERSNSIFVQDFKSAIAILFGSEARGLSAFWFEKATHLAKIPMSGVCDSLNVSVAAAVFIYEAIRQRS